MAIAKNTIDTPDGLGRHLERYSQTVAVNTLNTVASDSAGRRKLLYAYAKFSGVVTATLVVRLISGLADTDYDIEFTSVAITATEGLYCPSGKDIWLADGDVLEAEASAEVGETSAVALYMHLYGAPIRG